MAHFGKKQSYIEYLYTKPVLIILGICIVFVCVAVFERYRIEQEMLARYMQSQHEQQLLLEQKAQLEKKVEYLEGERGMEEEIRKHFDVAKEGEKVIILTGTDAQEEVEVEVEEPTPWYIFWR